MIITPAKFEDEMQRIAQFESKDAACIEADDLICKTLSSLGYDAGIRIFENIRKWYE